MRERRVRSVRQRRSRAEADELAAKYAAGGLTRAEFCRRHGLVLSTLAGYVTRWRRDHPEAESGREWVAVEVAESGAGTGSGLVLLLGRGRRIEIGRGFDAVTLQELLRALEPG